MKRIVAAIHVIFNLISVCADCAAIAELSFKLYDATKERICEFFYRRISDILDLVEIINCCGAKLYNLIEKIRWRRKYILI